MPVSRAKISRPQLPAILQRNRLFGLLDQARKRPIVWISAPAGAGKTTLVASWLEERNIPSLWYRCDRSDQDIATFFYYLAEAGRLAAPRCRKPLPHLAPEYQFDLPTFAGNFFENLFARLPESAVAVFDDFHEVPVNSPLTSLLPHMLNVSPPGISVIFASRSTPPALLSRFLANSQLVTLGQQDFTLSLSEMQELLELRGHGGIPVASLPELHERTRGWVAGVILMLAGFRGEHQREELRTLSDTSDLFAYFGAEVLAKADARERDFLLRTAFLPEMTGKMADELTGFAGSGRVLESLHRKCFFTEELLHAGRMYRYHPLFREFLQDEAGKTLPALDVVAIQRRAAVLLEEEGRFEDAATLYGKTEEWEGLVRLIISQAPSLIAQGRNATLEEWISRLPHEIAEASPWILFWLGTSRLIVNPGDARAMFDRAFTLFSEQNEPAGLFLSLVAAAESFFFESDDFTPADCWIERLEERLRLDPSFPNAEIECRVAASMAGLLIYRSPWHPATGDWADKAYALASSISDRFLRMQVFLQLFNYYICLGSLSQCALIIDEVDKSAGLPDAPPLMKIHAKMLGSFYYNLTADFDHALQLVAEALELAKTCGISILNHHLLLSSFVAAMNQEDLLSAEKYLEGMAASLFPARRWEAGRYHHMAGWYALAAGNLPRARFHAETSVQLTVTTGTPIPEALCRLGLAEACHESGLAERATAELASAASLLNRSMITIVTFRYRLLEAQIAFDRGEERRGLHFLREGMAFGREGGFVNNFTWWCPAVMARLCMKALEHDIEVAYVQDLIRRRHLCPDPAHSAIESWPWPLKIYTFGRLGLVRDGVPLTFAGKVQQKPLEMLKALIALGGRGVAEKQLSDQLWPNADWEEAHRSFTVTLHRLRRLLGSGKCIELHEARVTLDSCTCWVDAWVFERLAGKAEASLQKDCQQEAAETAFGVAQQAISLYRGDFFASDKDRSWLMSKRERLRSRMLRLVAMVGRAYEEQGAWDKAVDCYRRGLEASELAEELYQRLMRCYQQMGHHGEIVSLYQRCRKTFALHGIKPSAQTRAIYERAVYENEN